MAWTKVGETTFQVASGTGTENKTLPGTPAENDIVLVLHVSDAIIATSVTTADYNVIFNSGTANPGFVLSWKRLGASPDSVVTIQQVGDGAAGVIQIWRGADTTTAIDATRTTATGGSGMPNPPAYTPVTAGALIFAVGGLDDDNVASTVGAPSGYTNLIAADAGAGGNSTAMLASKEWVSGEEDPGLFTSTGGTDAWVAVTFALRPAAAGGGTLAADGGSYSLTGTAASLEWNHRLPADAATYTITGQDATLSVGQPIVLTAESGAYSIAGTAAALSRAVHLAADIGSYSVSGTAASTQWNHRLVADTVAYTLSGFDAGLFRGFSVSGESGAFTISGTDASFQWNHIINAEAGSYTLVGGAANLGGQGARLTAEAASYSLSGTAANSLWGHYTVGGGDSYALAGTAASLEWNRVLGAEAGAFALTGTVAALSRHVPLTADPGAYSLSGTAATLQKNQALFAEPGVYTITGPNAGLGGEPAGGGGLSVMERRRRS